MTAKADITADGEKRTRYYASATRTEHAAYRELRALQEVRRKYGLADFEEPARPEGDEAEGAQGEAGAASGPVSSETFAEAGSEGLYDAEGPEASVPDEAGAAVTIAMTGQEPREPGWLCKSLTGQRVGRLIRESQPSLSSVRLTSARSCTTSSWPRTERSSSDPFSTSVTDAERALFFLNSDDSQWECVERMPALEGNGALSPRAAPATILVKARSVVL